MRISRKNLFECIRLLIAQVREEQHSRQAMIRAMMVENMKPVRVPTDKEVTARIRELQEIIKKDLTTKKKKDKM